MTTSTISEKKLKQIKAIIKFNTLDKETLEYDTPWGEDGSIYAFEQGQKFGAHDLGQEILKILKSKE
jgi:hypothetical protein